MSNEKSGLSKTEELYEVNVIEHDRDEFSKLNSISKLRQSFKRGKELEEHLFDIYSSQLQKQKEQLEHQLFLGLDASKKKLYEEYLVRTSDIEKNITKKLNEMLRDNISSLSDDLEKLFDICDDLSEKAEKHKNNSGRYDKLKNSIKEMEMKGVNSFELRAQVLHEKHEQLFKRTVELFKEHSEVTIPDDI